MPLCTPPSRVPAKPSSKVSDEATLRAPGLLAVLGLLVPIEDGSLVEAAPTGRAVVGLLSRVDPLVPDQPLPLAEALATHLASIRLLAGVGAPVHSQVGVPAEALAALARVGLLPVCVLRWTCRCCLRLKLFQQSPHL